jgi:hypothetical protein
MTCCQAGLKYGRSAWLDCWAPGEIGYNEVTGFPS